MFKKTLFALLLIASSSAYAAGGGHVEKHDWPFNGIHNNSWDKDRLYRGYTVGTQVCMSCHSFKYISHRRLMETANFTEKEAKALAVQMEMKLDDKLLSALTPVDAKDLYGKEIPDLSLMNKARAGLADYVYALLTGYSEDPEELHHMMPDGIPEGAYFNTAFPGHAIAMPPPLSGPDLVEYHDGTEATVEQMAKDVVYFMQWTAEPELMKRKRLGVFALLFVFVFAVLVIKTKRAIWRNVH